MIIGMHEFDSDPGYMGSHRAVRSHQTGAVMYGGSLKDLVGSLWKQIGPVATKFLKSKEADQIIKKGSEYVSKAVEGQAVKLSSKGREKLAQLLSQNGGCVSESKVMAGKGIKHLL